MGKASSGEPSWHWALDAPHHSVHPQQQQVTKSGDMSWTSPPPPPPPPLPPPSTHDPVNVDMDVMDAHDLAQNMSLSPAALGSIKGIDPIINHSSLIRNENIQHPKQFKT